MNVEIGFEGLMTRAHCGLGYFCNPEETIANSYNVKTGQHQVLIEKSFDNLTPDEIRENIKEVRAGRLKEMLTLFEMVGE